MYTNPSFLAMPSPFASFGSSLPVIHVQGCLVLNPGHLSKGAGGGTFSQLTVHPLTGDGDEVKPHGVPARTRAEITRI